MASLTQDGSKYSHYMSSLQVQYSTAQHRVQYNTIQYSTVQYSFYMSSLQDSWKMDDTGIDFVLNRKFPRDTKDMSLVSGWYIIAIEFPRKKIT